MKERGKLFGVLIGAEGWVGALQPPVNGTSISLGQFLQKIVVPEHSQARLPAPRAGGGFPIEAHYKHFFTKIIKSLERAGGAAAPPAPLA